MSEDMVQFVDAFRQLAVLQVLLCSYTVATGLHSLPVLCALACFALIATGLDHKVTNKLDGTYAIKS